MFRYVLDGIVGVFDEKVCGFSGSLGLVNIEIIFNFFLILLIFFFLYNKIIIAKFIEIAKYEFYFYVNW